MKITRVYPQDGRYYYVQDLEARSPKTGRPLQKWHRLTRIDEGDEALLDALLLLLGEQPGREGDMPALIDEFKEGYCRTLTFQVKKEYERMYDVVAKAFKEFNARDAAPSDIEDFLGNFADKPTAQRHYKARLSTFFSWCVRKQQRTGVMFNPCREIKLKSPPKRRGKFDYEVFWKLYDKLPAIGQCFMMLQYLTRQRPTEIRLLRESQIRAEYIDFTPTKTERSSGEEVKVLITPEIRAELERARALRPQRKIVKLKDDPYLIQTRAGDHYTKNGFYEIWRDARAAADVPKVTTRHLRAFALAEMEKLGHGVREIQVAAAHASITTTEGYLDQYRERISDARLPAPPRKT